jgi:hypothetical protein
MCVNCDQATSEVGLHCVPPLAFRLRYDKRRTLMHLWRSLVTLTTSFARRAKHCSRGGVRRCEVAGETVPLPAAVHCARLLDWKSFDVCWRRRRLCAERLQAVPDQDWTLTACETALVTAMLIGL